MHKVGEKRSQVNFETLGKAMKTMEEKYGGGSGPGDGLQRHLSQLALYGSAGVQRSHRYSGCGKGDG